MKCENCKYLTKTSYEYEEYICKVFGDEPPEKYMTEDGCNCHWKTLKKMYNNIQEYENRYIDGIVDDFINKETEKVGIMVIFKGEK